MIARWSSTRERMLGDERRVGMGEIMEMDGTGLYERDNWPLVDGTDRSTSPETVISLRSPDGSSLPSPRSPKIEEDDVEEGAVMRKPEDIGQEPAAYFEEKDVSDLEEDSDEVSEDDELYDESRGSSPVLPRVSPSTDSPDPGGISDSSQPGSPNGHPRISPDAREQWRELQAPPREEQAEVFPIRDAHNAGDDESQTNGAPQDQSEELYGESDGHGITNGHADHEARDVATPIPFGLDGTSDSPPSNQTTPQAHGRSTPTMNWPMRQSSTLKGTPPSRNLSRRSASITKSVLHDKSKLRYSWQSVQDDEPSRPRIHIIKLLSNTATASAGFPQGEAFGFSVSPHGRRVAVYNSARLYVLQTAALPVGISQDYALKRRPLAVEISDEGTMLAILMDEHTVNVYDLGHQQLRRIRTIRTEYPANCIALASTGGLLATGYEGGAEIFSLASSALATDRRSVRSQRMDRLMFSDDCSTLLGTTTRINVSHTMVISVPVFPAAASGIPTHEELKEAWCTDLLNPENVRNSSHAAFMRENRETCNERLFAWNGLEDTFGILNAGDLQYGNIDFPVVISPPLSTCGGLGAAIHSCPAIDEHGDTVAMVVNDRTIRLYIVPQKAEDDETTVEAHSIDHELDEGYGCPFTEARWVYSSTSLPAPVYNQAEVKGRLIVTSPGGVVEPSMNEEPVDDIEGGRIILFDFDPQFAGQQGQTFSLTLGKSQPQLLEEPKMDVADEIAIVRRRTVNQNKGGALSQRPIALGRAASTFAGRSERQLRAGSPSFGGRSGRASIYSMQSVQLEPNRSLPDLVETNETLDVLDAMEEPYAQNAPRSQASLNRAASNAQRHRFQALEEKTQERVSVDSHGNFLPLPEYTEEPNAPLPSRFRAMAGLDGPAAAAPAAKPAVVTNMDGDRRSPASSTPSSAPAATSESFSAEQAFHAATVAQMNQDRQTTRPTPSSPSSSIPGLGSMSRSDTFSSINSIPRNLQRAYKNAPSPGGSFTAGEWESVSPTVGTNPGRQFPPPAQSSTWQRSRALSPPAETLPEEEPWDAISPMPPTSQSSRFNSSMPTSYSNRYSTSVLHPPGHSSPTRAPSSASSYGADSSSPSSTPSSRTRRLPPHIQSFHRAAAAANPSASLFPQTHASDHVPLPLREPSPRAGAMPHPVTAWHPPAPSIASAPPSGVARAHSRKSSLSNKSAFASTEKAKKLGFFRMGTTKKKNKNLYGPEFAPSRPPPSRGGESMLETRSMFTTFTRGEGKCVLM